MMLLGRMVWTQKSVEQEHVGTILIEGGGIQTTILRSELSSKLCLLQFVQWQVASCRKDVLIPQTDVPTLGTNWRTTGCKKKAIIHLQL